jgi:hypothetical protein
LEYATPGSDARVLYTREGDRATVVIHRPERRAQAAIDLAADAAGQMIFYLIIAGVFLCWNKPIWFLMLIPGGLALFGLVYGVAWLSCARLARPIMVELTPTELIFSNLDARAGPSRLSRKGLYSIYNVPHAKCIFVRRQGQEMLGFMLTSDVDESERIAAFLRDAAGLKPDATAQSSLASPSPA